MTSSLVGAGRIATGPGGGDVEDGSYGDEDTLHYDTDQRVGPEAKAEQRKITQVAGQDRQVGTVYEQVEQPVTEYDRAYDERSSSPPRAPRQQASDESNEESADKRVGIVGMDDALAIASIA